MGLVCMEVDGGLGPSCFLIEPPAKSSWDNDGPIEFSDLGVKGQASREAEDDSQTD